MDFEDTTCMGLVLTSFGEAMREPVTMISVNGPVSGAADTCGAAGVDGACASKILLAGALFFSSRGGLAIDPPDCDCNETPAPSESEEVEMGMTVTVFWSRYRYVRPVPVSSCSKASLAVMS